MLSLFESRRIKYSTIWNTRSKIQQVVVAGFFLAPNVGESGGRKGRVKRQPEPDDGRQQAREEGRN